MNAELRQLSVYDGKDIYDMLQELPRDENGFINGCNGISFEEFTQWLVKSHNTATGTGLADWMVPQTVYWLYVDGRPAGIGKLRHYLTDRLREEGGHCGYSIRPAFRNMGYGKFMLKLLISKAYQLGIDRLLLTIQNHNTPSIKVALANGGVIEKVSDQRHYIWIDCHL